MIIDILEVETDEPVENKESCCTKIITILLCFIFELFIWKIFQKLIARWLTIEAENENVFIKKKRKCVSAFCRWRLKCVNNWNRAKCIRWYVLSRKAVQWQCKCPTLTSTEGGRFCACPWGSHLRLITKIFVYIDEMTPQTNKFDLNYQPRRLSKFRSETLKVFWKIL